MWGTGADDDGTIPALYSQLDPSVRHDTEVGNVYSAGPATGRSNGERSMRESNRREFFLYAVSLPFLIATGGIPPRRTIAPRGGPPVCMVNGWILRSSDLT